MMPELTIVLLCHNRPSLAKRAITSILGQSNTLFNLIISDNSTNLDTRSLVQSEFPNLEYVSYFPGIAAFDHFKRAFFSIRTRYFIIFHDDDVMGSNYVEQVLRAFKENHCLVAVATNNGFIDVNGKTQVAKTGFSIDKDLLIQNPRDLLLRYLLGEDAGGVVPFCSYAYRTEKIKGLFPDYNKGRNYCDTIFLVEVLSRGNFLWLKDPLMNEFLNPDNLSQSSGTRDYKAFVSFVKSNYSSEVSKLEIEQYRCLRLLWNLKRRGKMPYPALKYFMFWIPFLSFRSRFIRRSLLSWVFRVLRFGWK